MHVLNNGSKMVDSLCIIMQGVRAKMHGVGTSMQGVGTRERLV